MKENNNYHTRTISIIEIQGEQWLGVVYYAPLTSPACAHWHLLYQRPEFICQTCYERFPVEKITIVMTLEEFLNQVSSYIFAEYANAKAELYELQKKIEKWETNYTKTETEEPKQQDEETPTEKNSP